ncbi:MAG: HlyD family efflux transporter periplasmic adaptor subunit [Pseudomonadota bacterium]
MARILRWTLGVILVCGLGAALAWAFWPRPIPADFAVIERRALQVTVADEGTTRISEIYTVSAPLGGKVSRSPREVGDAVEADKTLVALIEPNEPTFLDIRSRREAEAAVQAAQAAVALAEARVLQAAAQVRFARTDLKRAQELAPRRTIAPRELEERELDVASAEADLASAHATADVRRRELDSARAGLIQPGSALRDLSSSMACCVEVRAPIDGVVVKIITESEQVVTPGTPLLEIGNRNELEVMVDLLSRDAVKVDVGDRAWIDGWGGGEKLEATVVRVDPAAETEISALGIEEQRVETILHLVEPGVSAGRLGHNFRVIAHIVIWEKPDALTIPLSALFRSGSDWAAFKVVEGRAALARLEIGRRNQRFAEVVSGLEPGDTVVTHPNDTILDGSAVIDRALN